MMISIIIPCFNSGVFLLEALAICFESSYKNFEVIIVDDGSYELETLKIFDHLKNNNSVKVFSKTNGGPASARNLGVANSKGEFLLFLDSDNRIRPDYLSKVVSLFQEDSSLGVVYCKPHFFGEFSGYSKRFEVRDFSFDALMAGNYIDMCSVVRKDVFLDVGGFDEHRDLIGWEDWDLWLRIAQTAWKFHFLDEVLFDYRVSANSLMGTVDDQRKERMLRYFGSKHGYLIHYRYRRYFRLLEKLEAKPFTYFLKVLYNKYVLRRNFFQE